MRLRHALLCLTAAIPLFAGSLPALAAEGGSGVRKATQSESYVVIEPMYASIIDGVTPRGLLLVELGLDIPDSTLRERVAQNLPAMRDAYLRALLSYAATSVRVWRQPNVEDIANRMQAITNKIVGREGAKVLMSQTAIRITR